VTYLIEYWGEFEFIFEIILDYESGTRWALLMQKKHHKKSHAWAPLKGQSSEIQIRFLTYMDRPGPE
jgi:hypothetical protein